MAGELIFSRKSQDLVDALKGYDAVFVIADRTVRSAVAEPLVEALAEGGAAIRGVRYVRGGENHKTLGDAGDICRWLLGVGADRNALLLAVGGGVITDLTGFVAGIYKRGIRYACVPTTILGQCDAAIGGKTACDIAHYKNMAGLFMPVEFTFINTDYIRTLPWREVLCGYAELLKTFIIASPTAYRDAVRSKDFTQNLPFLIEEAARIKAAIVAEDPLDKGGRRVLNLGHTFAHAIECLSARPLLRKAIPGEKSIFGMTGGAVPHGLAVSIGIIMAARMSERLGLAQPGLTDRLERDFCALGLPTRCPWTGKELESVIATDKKNENGGVHYVLIRQIGEVVVK